jgi:hypothetical protein
MGAVRPREILTHSRLAPAGFPAAIAPSRPRIGAAPNEPYRNGSRWRQFACFDPVNSSTSGGGRPAGADRLILCPRLGCI